MSRNLPFGFEKAEDSPGFLLWQITIIWQRQIRKMLEIHNISYAQFVIMASLLWFETHNYNTTQILLAERSKLDKMTVSKALKQLVLLNLVTRFEHEIDTRAKKVSLTAEGKKLIYKLVPIVEKIDEEFFAKITNSEKQMFTHILRKLSKKTKNE